MLAKALERISPGDAVASMGYPDLVMPEKVLRHAVGDRYRNLKFQANSEEICKRHGLDFRPVPEAESLFEQFGASLDVYDIVRERGTEIVLDLNQPYPENSREQYEMVFDAGTLEHCFNVGQAALNMAAMVKRGGWIFHETPWNWGNHAFYSLQPTWFHDFYEANGFEVESCRLTTRDYNQTEELDRQRFVFDGDEVVLLTIAKRLEVKPFVYPMQGKYRKKNG